MKTLQSIYTSARTQLLYIVLLPTFFLAFVMSYQPRAIVEYFAMDGTMLTFNMTILSCIVLGVVLLSRILMFLTQRQRKMSLAGWIIWQLAEMLIASMFMALYMALMYHGEYPYYGVIGKCFVAIISTDIYVYIFLTMILAWMASNEKESALDDSLIRFVDNQKQVKLIIASSSVLYIEAKENYVLVKYLDGETVKEYCLRSTMLGLEPLMTKHGMIRCQRSYYVNPAHVKVLRKDKEGVVTAELDVANSRSIPVSPKYYEILAARL